MPGVALFVDHENIFIGLKEILGLRAPDRSEAAARAAYQSQNQMLVATLAAGLRREAEKLGPVRLAYAVANYSQFDFFHHPSIYAHFGFEPRYNVAGRNSADTFITNLVNEVLADPRHGEIEFYVLVSGDGGYFYVVQKLVDQQRQVHVWGITGHTSRLLQGLETAAIKVGFVDQIVDFSAVRVAVAAATSPARSPGIAAKGASLDATATANGASPDLPVPDKGAGRDMLIPQVTTGKPAEERREATSYSRQRALLAGPRLPGLSDMQILIALFDEQLAASRLDFLSPRLFLEFLEANQLGGSDETSRSRYLQEALQIGVVREERVWLGDREGVRILANESSEVVSRYRLVRDALFSAALAKPLHPTDRFRPKRSFVVFSILRAAPGLEGDEVHRWLDWFVRRGLLISAQERLPRDAQPANILKMNTEHRMVQALLAGVVWERIAIPLFILTVHQLLRLPPRPWVALSLLLRRIGEALPVSREELRAAVGRALAQNVLIKREYPNPRRPEPTSGVHLGDVPEVVQTLETARRFVSRVVELARPTGQVPISYFIQQCAGADLCDGDFDRIKDWITVLEKVGLLLLRTVPHAALLAHTMTVVSPDNERCRSFLAAGAGAGSGEAPGEARLREGSPQASGSESRGDEGGASASLAAAASGGAEAQTASAPARPSRNDSGSSA